MITIDEYFNKVFVINLAHRKDKWQLVTQQLEKMNIYNYERFDAIKPDISEVSTEYFEYFKKHNNSDGPDETYAVGGMGCKLSHLAVINIAKNRGYERTLVLEDDVEFRPDAPKVFSAATEQVQSLNQWQMLYFTGNHGKNYTNIAANLIKIGSSHSTVGYAVHKSVYDTIVEYGPKQFKHIDVFYKERIHPFFNCYCIQPHLVWNMDGYSDIEQGFRNYKVLKREYK